MRFCPLIFLAIILLSSCVSNKKTVLLQKDDLYKQSGKDSVLRSYNPEPFDYKVQSNDVLYVRFQTVSDDDYNFLSPNMQQSGLNAIAGGLLLGELVDENGEIGFPAVGKVKVAGLTIFEIEKKLQEVAEKYLESPVVKVRLMNYRFTMLGEVTSEGSITLSNNRVSMLEAIALGGGLGEFADRSNVKLIRQKGNQVEVQYIDLLDENFVNSPYYYVNQNDVIIVPPLKQKPFRKYFGSNFSLVLSSVSLILLVISLSR